MSRQKQITKKRSECLKDILDEISKTETTSSKPQLSICKDNDNGNGSIGKECDNLNETKSLHRRKNSLYREKPRERWLLTRKTWKYMSDAGRKLLPDSSSSSSSHNKLDDFAKIEEYFNELCDSQPEFIIWRKLSKENQSKFSKSFRHRFPKIQSLDVQEQVELLTKSRCLELLQEYLFTQSSLERKSGSILSTISHTTSISLNVNMRIANQQELYKCINWLIQNNKLSNFSMNTTTNCTSLSSSQILHDQPLLLNIYQQLKAAPNITNTNRRFSHHSLNLSNSIGKFVKIGNNDIIDGSKNKKYLKTEKNKEEHIGKINSVGTQTVILTSDEIKSYIEKQSTLLDFNQNNSSAPLQEKIANVSRDRKRSTDNDDISESVSETIKRYLRMARKKSDSKDKGVGLNRVNYDYTLRNIKPTFIDQEKDLDIGSNKSSQTTVDWATQYFYEFFDQKDDHSKLDSNDESKVLLLSAKESISVPTSPVNTYHNNQLTSYLSDSVAKKMSDPSFKHKFKKGLNVQKSLSYVNVTDFFNRKILKRHLKHEKETKILQKWKPLAKGQWISDVGQTLKIEASSLNKLSEVEYHFLPDIVSQKLNDLNISDLFKTVNYMKLSTKKGKPHHIHDLANKSDEKTYKLFGTSLDECIENDLMYLDEYLQTGRDTKYLNETDLHENYPLVDSPKCSNLDNMEFSKNNNKLIHDLQVPFFVIKCIDYLEKNGLDKIGLFRVSSSKKRILELKTHFDNVILKEFTEDVNPHDAATLLKEFIRDLPEPLVTEILQPAFLNSQKIRNRKIQLEGISHLIKLLPWSNRDTLFFLLKFLSKVALHSEDLLTESGEIKIFGNKMDSKNLASIFAPNVFTLKVKKISDKSSHDDAIAVTRTMIEHHEELFTVSTEILHDVYVNMFECCPEFLNLILDVKACNEREKGWDVPISHCP